MQIRQRTIQNLDHLALYDLIEFVEQAVKDGFSAPPIEDADTFPRRHGPGMYYVAMVKEDGSQEATYDAAKPVLKEAPPKEEALTEDDKFSLMEQCKNVEELKKFAQDVLGVAIPNDKQKFIAVKSWLKKVLEGDIE